MTTTELDTGLTEIRDALKALWEIAPGEAAELLAGFRHTALEAAPGFGD